MAATLRETIQRLTERIDMLEAYYLASLERQRGLAEENAELRAEARRLEEELRLSRRDNEYLALSHKLASHPDEVVRARRQIAGLISDIDKCISLLGE